MDIRFLGHRRSLDDLGRLLGIDNSQLRRYYYAHYRRLHGRCHFDWLWRSVGGCHFLSLWLIIIFWLWGDADQFCDGWVCGWCCRCRCWRAFVVDTVRSQAGASHFIL